jgi:hypothetical protein
LERTTVQDEATMLRTAGGKAGRRTAWRRQSPGGRGWSGRKPPAFRGPTAAWRGARVSEDFGRPVAAENPVGQRTGGAAETVVR